MDDSWRLLRDGYLFGERGFRRSHADVFRTRLLGRKVTVVRGLDAARFFYEGGRFDRSPGAVPASAVHLLQDSGSVQTLEGERHLARKDLFLATLAEHSALVDLFRDSWVRRADAQMVTVPLLEFASGVLTEAGLRWAGVDAEAIETSEFTSMIDNAGIIGPPNWLTRARRAATERTARRIVESARAASPAESAVSRIANFVENGQLLPVNVAAIELLNLIRPTVAVARFIVFAAHALHRRPDLRAVAATDPASHPHFGQEVRRFYPFFPMVGGHATRGLEWRGIQLPVGSWVMLDLYGTDHHEAIWAEPRRFDPSRFATTTVPPIAQGFGDFASTHHCPGEPTTVDLVAASVDLLVNGPRYTVPEQDLRISLRRFPAAPRDGFIVEFAR